MLLCSVSTGEGETVLPCSDSAINSDCMGGGGGGGGA